MKTRNLRDFAVVCAVAALAVTHGGDAEACGMSIRMDPTPQKPTPVQEIAKAEKQLEAGQDTAAARTILATFPKVRVVSPAESTNPLETRALRVFSLAVVRSNGSLTEKTAGMPSAQEWTANANLEWAVQALREIDAKRPNDPSVQADLGEALSKLPLKRDEALGLLQALAQKDLMGSPHAYAALAKIRSEKGDAAGAELAIKRCEEMSKVPGVCKPAAPKHAAPSFIAAKA